MRKIIKLRWVLLGVWIIGLIALILTSPDMGALVREKGSYALPDSYSTSQASKLEKQFSGKDTTAYVAIFHSDNGLSAGELQAIKRTLHNVKDNKDSLKIESVTDSFDHQELKDQFLSKNKKTLMAALEVQDVNQTDVNGVRQKIAAAIKTDGVKTYLTGQEPINNDMNKAAEAGLHRTEGITVVFIIAVLLLVFRSVVAPFIPLFTVGLSYMVAQIAVTFLVKYFNFPVSNYTQIFMVVVMFGIGTDYCILLMSRFKEELAKGADQYQATLTTFKTAGLTVLHSGIPVFIAFLSLSFVQFNLYRSGVAVGVGVIFLLLALFTLLPLFMSTLGKRLFWPLRGRVAESKSDLWAGAGKLAFTRPLVALLIVALFTIPPIIAYHGQLSFNSPEELADSYPAKQGYNIISHDFGAGNLSPATIYLKNDDNMKNTDYVEQIERISIALKKDPHVDTVMSISRPVGDRLNDIYVTKQADTLHKGLTDATGGLNTLQKNLQSASDKVDAAQPQLRSAAAGIDSLQRGTTKTQKGVQQLHDVLAQISTGIQSGASGTAEIRRNIHTARAQLAELRSGQQQLQNGYQQVAQNLHLMSTRSAELRSGQQQLQAGYQQVEKNLGKMSKKSAELRSGQQQLQNGYGQVAQNLGKLSKSSAQLHSGQQQLQGGYQQVAKALHQLSDQLNQSSSASGKTPTIDTSQLQKTLGQVQTNLKAYAETNQAAMQDAHFQQMAAALKQLPDDLKNLQTAATKQTQSVQGQIDQLNQGLKSLADNTDQLNSKSAELGSGLSQFQSGLSQLQSGQNQLNAQSGKVGSGLGQFQSGLSQLQSGQSQLNTQSGKVSNGLGQFQSGLTQLDGGLGRLNSGSTKVDGGLEQFQSGLTQLDNGLSQLENGLNQAGNAQDQTVKGSGQLAAALKQIAAGQAKLKKGSDQVQGQMKTLSSGLAQGAGGAKQIKNGVNSANDFINNWTKVPYAESGIYVPDKIFDNKDFQSALDTYLSDDGKITEIQVKMKDDPYTNAGIAHFRALKADIPSILKGTKLENAHVGISGTASTNSDLKQLADADYRRVVTYVIIGVFIALTIVLRSLSMPIYLMASLLLTYFSSMGFTELIFGLFHYTGLTWITQFFSFIVLVALGIDYSIFVMTRFNEYAGMALQKRMLLTLWHMGSVIFSAVIILSGTFAALIPSGMLSLIEIATVVIIGLFLYATIVIPLFVPVMVKFFGRGNWWPFLPTKKDEVDAPRRGTTGDPTI
ncbi:MAG: MMPL family transporter [Sporolactobacillus sp.]|jgi:RND superfamily putative drug exporter|nr:MMPL family transporter [Sporolactobacillus sp.]